MAETWKTKPPYPHWRGYAKHLRSYADDRIVTCHLPEGTTLAEWYRLNEAAMRSDPCLWDKQSIVAAELLPNSATEDTARSGAMPSCFLVASMMR